MGEICLVKKREISDPPQVKDESLNRWLNMLNTKLDYLISLTPTKREGSIFMAIEPSPRH